MKYPFGIIVALSLMIAPNVTVRAHDWTGNHDPQIAAWFNHQRRKVDNMSCCGLGDAYKVKIIEEADRSKPFDETGVAEITDGSAIDENMTMVVDGATTEVAVHRTPLPRGLRFKFRFSELTREAEGNPTNSAWAFLSVWDSHKTPADNYLSQVYCVVPLPPNS